MINHGGQNPIEAAFLGKTIIHGPNTTNFADVYDILNHMKLTSLVKNERQLQMHIEDKYKKSNITSSKLASTRIKKEGKKALQMSMNEINQLI